MFPISRCPIAFRMEFHVDTIHEKRLSAAAVHRTVEDWRIEAEKLIESWRFNKNIRKYTELRNK
jgi:hypothetical protein